MRVSHSFNTCTLLFCFQDPLKQLKDLTQLKKQLEEIQRRVENEVSVGLPQVCGDNYVMLLSMLGFAGILHSTDRKIRIS